MTLKEITSAAISCVIIAIGVVLAIKLGELYTCTSDLLTKTNAIVDTVYDNVDTIGGSLKAVSRLPGMKTKSKTK